MHNSSAQQTTLTVVIPAAVMITACMCTHTHAVCMVSGQANEVDKYISSRKMLHTHKRLVYMQTLGQSTTPFLPKTPSTLTKTIAMFEYNNHVMINYIASIAYTQKLGGAP